jgi:hypothetical protein
MDGRWKAIRPNLKRNLDIELYDLAGDVGETTNLANSKPDLVARAKSIFLREHRLNPDFRLDRIDRSP